MRALNVSTPLESLLPVRRWPRWKAGLLVAGVWMTIALLSGLQTYYIYVDMDDPRWKPDLIKDLLWAMRPALTWALLTPAAWWLVRRYPPTRPREFFAAQLLGLAAGVVVQTAGRAIAMHLLNEPESLNTFGGRFGMSLRGGFTTNIISYVMLVGVLLTVETFRRLSAERERSAQLQFEAVRARLAGLQSQLQPHFLFNTLHAISSLVTESPTRAVEMIARLGELLRESLQRGERGEVALQEELEFAERYLAIEQVRFGERLHVEWSVAPQARDVLVPPFFLQPLVENAVQHGIARSGRPGRVDIRAVLAEDAARLRVEVMNTGPVDEAPRRGGLGLSLANLRARLEAIYGAGTHEVSLTLRPETGGSSAVISLPARRAQETDTPVPRSASGPAPLPAEAASRPC